MIAAYFLKEKYTEESPDSNNKMVDNVHGE